jgi:uncharacterized protein (UPF0297 family)
LRLGAARQSNPDSELILSGGVDKQHKGDKMANISNTQFFKVKNDPEVRVKEVLDVVYNAMSEKGYNPVNQIVGYVMSGDPTYITSYKGARSMIMKVERDEIVEELLKEYIKHKSWERD